MDEDYKLPPITLLEGEDVDRSSLSDDELRSNLSSLVEAFRRLGIEAFPGDIRPGSSSSKYEITCRDFSGAALKKLRFHEADLSAALGGVRANFVEPQPIGSAIHIVAQNRPNAGVPLRELVDTPEWTRSRAIVPLLLGQSGSEALITDFARLPHLLVGGMTGSGKSNFVHSTIVSWLLRFSPKDLKLVLFDLHGAELSGYERVPHLFSPLLSQPNLALAGIEEIATEVDRRFKLFGKYGAHDFTSLKERIEQRNEGSMPLIVLVIDNIMEMIGRQPAFSGSIAQLAANCHGVWRSHAPLGGGW